METNNPYATPQTQADIQPKSVGDLNNSNSVEFSTGAMTALIKTKSWIKFIAFTLVFTAITAIVALFSLDSTFIFLGIHGVMIAIVIFALVIPIFIAIFMYLFCSRAKRYSQSRSAEAFDSLASGHSKLYLTLTVACIAFLLGFFVLIYFIVSQLYGVIREVSHENNKPTHLNQSA